MSRSALDRILRRHQVPSLKALADAEKASGQPAPGKDFKDYEPGFIHMDIKYLLKLEGAASRRYLFVAIDRCTRWVFTKIYGDQTDASSTDFLYCVHEACPVKIVKLLTDNGTQFTDRFRQKDKTPTGKHAFDRTCAALEITHRLIPPRTPPMNGMVERFNGRISEVLRTPTSRAAQILRRCWTSMYGCITITCTQRALGHVSPIDAMKQWQEKKPELFIRPVSTLGRTYAKVFQQGKAPKTVHSSTARRLNAAGAVLRKSY